MTEFWLVRHGQTAWNLERRYQGQTDIPLNQTGIRQAQLLAASVNGQSFNAVISSDLMRASTTANILAEKIGLPVQFDPRLREANQGEWEGKLLDDVLVTYREQAQALHSDPENSRAPGGESLAEVALRMKTSASEWAAWYPHGRILLVSHGLALAALVCLAERRPLREAYPLIPDNCQFKIINWPPSY